MLLYGVGLYLVWGVSLLCSPQGLGATVMGVFKDNNVSNITAGTLFLISATLTLVGLFLKDGILSLILCFPQQILLIINSLSCIECIFKQQYSDGVVRPFAFILVDQFPFVFATAIHFIALLDICLFSDSS